MDLVEIQQWGAVNIDEDGRPEGANNVRYHINDTNSLLTWNRAEQCD
jgi:hypothetical protein